MMTGEQYAEMYVQRSAYGILWGTIPAHAWSDGGQKRKSYLDRQSRSRFEPGTYYKS